MHSMTNQSVVHYVQAQRSSDHTSEGQIICASRRFVHPPVLFDETLMLREAQKSVLGDAIWSKLEPGTIESIGEVQYVLDEVCFTIYHGHVVH